MTGENEKQPLHITDKEKRAKTEFTDKPPRAQTKITSREDTARNIEDRPRREKVPHKQPEDND